MSACRGRQRHTQDATVPPPPPNPNPRSAPAPGHGVLLPPAGASDLLPTPALQQQLAGAEHAHGIIAHACLDRMLLLMGPARAAA